MLTKNQAPAEEAIEYGLHRFSELDDHFGPFTSDPSPEVDDAWDELVDGEFAHLVKSGTVTKKSFLNLQKKKSNQSVRSRRRRLCVGEWQHRDWSPNSRDQPVHQYSRGQSSTPLRRNYATRNIFQLRVLPRSTVLWQQESRKREVAH